MKRPMDITTISLLNSTSCSELQIISLYNSNMLTQILFHLKTENQPDRLLLLGVRTSCCHAGRQYCLGTRATTSDRTRQLVTTSATETGLILWIMDSTIPLSHGELLQCLVMVLRSLHSEKPNGSEANFSTIDPMSSLSVQKGLNKTGFAMTNQSTNLLNPH